MKYLRRTQRLLAFILVLAIMLVNTASTSTVYAADLENSMNTITNLLDDGIALTTLVPNTSQDWAIAFKDGIKHWSFFHNKVEEDIKIKNIAILPDELVIPGAGRYGYNGRADLVQVVNGITNIWEVKPASNGYFPLKNFAVSQVEKYVAADVFYRAGSNDVIQNSFVDVILPSGVKYMITYQNSLYDDGLIFYRFDRIGKPQEEPEPQPATQKVTSTEKEKAVMTILDEDYVTSPTITVDWGTVSALVTVASTISAAGVRPYSTSVEEALFTSSTGFLVKLGRALAGVAGGAFSGAFTNPQIVLAAEDNPENADLKAINELVDEYGLALEVLLGLDSLDDLLDAYNNVDEDELDEMIKAIQGENGDYENASEAQPPRDPLVIDFKTLGIDLCSLTKGVNFDLDNNGFAEKTAWIGTEDGFLALDRNKNGVIDNGGELFGDQVDIGNGNLSKSGFEALQVVTYAALWSFL